MGPDPAPLSKGLLPMQIRLSWDETGHENIEVTEQAPGRFRLEDTPLFPREPVFAGDIIETAQLPDGTRRFVRITERSRMRHYSWILARAFMESPRFRAFGYAIEAAGGRWEVIAGGVFHAHVPETSGLDVEAELHRRLNSDLPEE